MRISSLSGDKTNIFSDSDRPRFLNNGRWKSPFRGFERWIIVAAAKRGREFFFTCTCKDTHKPVLRKTSDKSWLECGGKTSDFEEPSEENRSIHFKTIFDNYLFEKN